MPGQYYIVLLPTDSNSGGGGQQLGPYLFDLRYALTQANQAANAGSIVVLPTGAITLSAPLPTISQSMTIIGNGGFALWPGTTITGGGNYIWAISCPSFSMSGVALSSPYQIDITCSGGYSFTECYFMGLGELTVPGLVTQAPTGAWNYCYFSGNVGNGGHQWSVSDTNITITNCLFSGCTSSVRSFFTLGMPAGGSMAISGSVFSGSANNPVFGGGPVAGATLSVSDSFFTSGELMSGSSGLAGFTNCVFYSCSGWNGSSTTSCFNAISNANLLFINCTATGNSGGSSFGFVNATSGKVCFANCILYNNTGTGGDYGGGATFTAVSSDIEGYNPDFLSGSPYNAASMFPSLPFSMNAYYFPLANNSPCIAAGTASFTWNGGNYAAPSSDIRGASQTSPPTLGAYVPSPIYFSSTGGNNGSWGPGPGGTTQPGGGTYPPGQQPVGLANGTFLYAQSLISGNIQLSWDNVGVSASGWDVWRSSTFSSSLTLYQSNVPFSGSAYVCTWTDTGVTLGNTYFYQVVPTGTNTNFSNEVFATATMSYPIAVPKVFRDPVLVSGVVAPGAKQAPHKTASTVVKASVALLRPTGPAVQSRKASVALRNPVAIESPVVYQRGLRVGVFGAGE